MAPFLLDTCAVIWISAGKRVEKAVQNELKNAFQTQTPVHLSPITAWEIGLLVSRGRLPSSISEKAILDRLITTPGVSYAEMPPDVLIASSYLPGNPPSDPADRIIISTARNYGMTIITRDRRILEYSELGHVNALPC